MKRLSDVYIALGFCSSRKEFKRQAAVGSVKVNGTRIEEDMVFLPTGTLTLGLPLGNNCYAIPPIYDKLSETEWLVVYHDIASAGGSGGWPTKPAYECSTHSRSTNKTL